MSDYVSTDTMSAAAGFVSREFGYGYGIRVVRTGFVNTLFELHAGDGSRRLFLCDRYGNIGLAPLEVPDADGDYDDWCMTAANELYFQRNGRQSHESVNHIGA